MSHKKLYRVTVEHTTYVLADNMLEAEDVAREALRDEEPEFWTSEVAAGEDFAKSGWDEHSLVWGADEDTRLVDVWPKAPVPPTPPAPPKDEP